MVIPIDGGGRDTLYDVYTGLRDIARRLFSIGVIIEEIPVLGEVLASPFHQMSNVIFYLSNVWMGFYRGYWCVIDSIRDILSGNLLVELLDWLFPSWRGLSDYPLMWWLEIVYPALSSIDLLIYAPGSWVRDRLIEVFPFAADFLFDPAFGILELLLSFDPSWGDLLSNPEDFVIQLISYYLGEWGEFIIDPLGWLQGWLSVLLGLPPDFWSNPWGEGVDMILEVLDTERSSFRTRLLQVGERVLRMLWEGA